MVRISTSRAWRGIVAMVIGLGMTLALKLSASSAQATDTRFVLSHPDMSQGSALMISSSGAYTTYMPATVRYVNTHTPPFAVQFSSAPGPSTGLPQASDAGIRWIRMPISWADIEPANTSPVHYNWSGLDQSVTNAVQEDIELILTIGGQPTWAAIYPMGPVTNTADLVEFVGALVERYDGDGVSDAPGSPQARYFELYNEPDNADPIHASTGGWGYWGHNGAGYAALLQTLYPVVRAASPQASLVFGGLALDWFEDQGGPFDRQFLDDVLAACQGQNCFDVMNFHYYPAFRDFWEPYGTDIIGKANYVRQKLTAYGFTSVPVICTETSWGSSVEWGGQEPQSRYVVKGYVRGMAAGLDIIVWYKIDDQGESFLPGLLDDSLQPKPAYWAYQTMTGMLEDASYERALTIAETGSEQIEGYVFRVYGQRIDVVWLEDDTPYNGDDDPMLPLTVQAQTLRVTDKHGNATWLNDGDDGTVDGRITIQVSGSPLYLEYNP